jgi:hypothetical protein
MVKARIEFAVEDYGELKSNINDWLSKTVACKVNLSNDQV